jgi:CHC2 zinc finger/Toprim domain
MPALFRDFETRSVVNLKTAGPRRYAADPATQVLCVAYAADEGPVRIWLPGQPVPDVFRAAAEDPSWLVVAHADQFETAIEEHILAPAGWPLIPLHRHRCTLAMALAAALPASLHGAAEALELPFRKDADGHRLMLQMTKPRRPRKSEDPTKIYWVDDPEKRQRLYQYCRTDVEVERQLYQKLRPLSEAEELVWQLDAEINRRGFHVDRPLAEAARRIVGTEQNSINARIAALTSGAVNTVDEVARIKDFANARGHRITTIAKRGLAAALSQSGDETVNELLELRRDGGKASARKLDTLLASIDADDRVRGCFRYHGASTGRWSGQRFQPQNLAKEFKETPAAIDAILAGDLGRLRQLGAPLAVVGAISRTLITAAPGHVLIGADYSAIESRVLAWISGEAWKLENYRRYDLTNDSALEPYCLTASKLLKRKVTPADEAGRGIGKVADLACGYGGGVGAWKRFATSDQRRDDQIKADITKWREAHPATCHFWKALEAAMRRAIRTGSASYRNLAFSFADGVLYLVLPSGRRLAYPKAKIVPGDHDTPQICFCDNAGGHWTEIRGWYGTFTENVVQAIARDILAEAMLRLNAAGYQIVVHVHDEIVCEVPECTDTDQFLSIMTRLPTWASGLPLVAKAWTNKRYIKAASAPATATRNIEISTAAPPAEPLRETHTIEIARGVSFPIRSSVPAMFDGVPKIHCPFHADDTPSMVIYEDHVHCFGCKAHLDLVDFVMMTEGVDRDEAERLLASGLHQDRARERDPAENAASLQFAEKLWNEGRPIAGTRAAKYLSDVRGIDLGTLPGTIDDALRYHPNCPFASGVNYPCLLARYSDVLTDAFAGLHRIALTPKVFTGAKVQRKTLGQWHRPKAVKLWKPNGHLFLAEGIETALAAVHFKHKGEPLAPVWAAGCTNNVAVFPVLDLKLTLLVDHDEPGEESAKACLRRYRAAGRDPGRLRTMTPGTDFNDLLLARRRDTA